MDRFMVRKHPGRSSVMCLGCYTPAYLRWAVACNLEPSRQYCDVVTNSGPGDTRPIFSRIFVGAIGCGWKRFAAGNDGSTEPGYRR